MEMNSPQPCPPTVTIRRNPSRKARSTNLSAIRLREPLSSPSPSISNIPSFPLQDVVSTQLPQKPNSTENCNVSSPIILSENLKVYLRIRPLAVQRSSFGFKNTAELKNAWPKNQKGKNNNLKPKTKKSSEICVQVNEDLRSVTVLTPEALQETKRIKSEVYEGFSQVFSPEASQIDVYDKMVNPLIEDFHEGKSGMLAAMGPSGSGKTHTIFGCPREPGMIPLALRRIFSENESDGTESSRVFYLSMFEICSEKGKAERMVDLLQDGGEICMQQSILKGLQEVVICDAQQAESLIARGMLKRSTAMTNSNSQSSRSQCIINIRYDAKKGDGEADGKASSTMLTIVDLAGAEREKKTGNQGARLLESNFINNTSMIFGLCLRSLLEHQKNRTKPLQKHYQNSLLTRYLRDYLEGKKRMMLILTVKPGIEDYLDTSFLLRQASPFTKIMFKNLVEPVNLTRSKRPNQALPQADQLKKMKFSGSEVHLIDGGNVDRVVRLTTQEVPRKVVKEGINQSIEDVDDENLTEIEVLNDGFASHDIIGKSYLEGDCMRDKTEKDRNYQIMQGFSKALWTVLKQYKEKLKGVEIENCHLRDTLTHEKARNSNLENKLTYEKTRLFDLENELKKLKSRCTCFKEASDEIFPVSFHEVSSNRSQCHSSELPEVDSSATFVSCCGGVEEHCPQQLLVLSKSIDDPQDVKGFKDSNTLDMHSGTEEDVKGFKDSNTLDIHSGTEEDVKGFKDSNTLDMHSGTEDFAGSTGDAKDLDGFKDTGAGDMYFTTEATSLLISPSLNTSHEWELTDGNTMGVAKNLNPESECVPDGSGSATSLECQSANTSRDFENLRDAKGEQTRLENSETGDNLPSLVEDQIASAATNSQIVFSSSESPWNGDSCFQGEDKQLNNDECKLHPLITVLHKEGWDGRNMSKFASCSNFQHNEKPKRRLLPSSSVLLKDISKLEIEYENEKPKGAKGEKKVPVDDNRTQGSISLLHLLTTKLHR